MIDKLVKAVEAMTGEEIVAVHCHTTVKTTLRAQWSSARSRWRIVKKTDNGSGGWKMFGGSHGYVSKMECDDKIKFLIETNPDQYREG